MAESKNKYQYGILTILIVSLVIRFWGINHQIYTDENKIITPSVLLAQGKQTPLLYPKGSYYPHLYHYVLGVAFLPAAMLDSPYPGAGTSVDTYTLIARIITALFGTATIYVVYKIGAELLNNKMGIIAALLFAFLPLHVKYSHYTHVDIPLTFVTTLALFTALKIWNTGKYKWYILTGILTGVSGAIHYTGLVIGITLIIAHGNRILKNREYPINKIFSRSFVYALLIIPISFIMCTPYTAIKWQESSAIYHQLQLRGAAGDLGYTRPSFLWPLYTASPDWGLPFTVSGVWWEFNPLMVTLSILGIYLAIYKRNWTLVALIGGSLCVMYIAIIGRLPLYAIKRLLPLAPLSALLAAWALYELQHARKIHHILSFSLSIAIIAVIVLQNGITALGFDSAYTHGSTHSAAVAWALENLPHDSVVLQHTPIRLIDWNDTNYKIVRLNEVYANFNKKDPEVSHDRAKPLSYWTQEQAVEYIAMDSRIVDRYFDPTSVALFPETTASYQAFYTKIRAEGKLVYKIQPQLWQMAGPRVEIYDIRNIQ